MKIKNSVEYGKLNDDRNENNNLDWNTINTKSRNNQNLNYRVC